MTLRLVSGVDVKHPFTYWHSYQRYTSSREPSWDVLCGDEEYHLLTWTFGSLKHTGHDIVTEKGHTKCYNYGVQLEISCKLQTIKGDGLSKIKIIIAG